MIRTVAQARVVNPVERRRDLVAVGAIAGAVLAVHLALSGRYGFHRDELYHLAAGRHPALGYVDHPPLVPLLGRAVAALAGEHLWPLRAAAGAVHAVLVLLAAGIARELGGVRRAPVLAALATATMPLLLATGSLFQTVVFDQLWWAVVLLLVVRLLNGADARWWLAVGAAFGFGLETKWTIALLGIGLAIGVAAVPEARRHLRSPWLWAGCAVALLLWLPNLVWLALDDWQSLDFIGNSNQQVRAEDGRLGFVLAQIALIGPLALPLVGAGVAWLWRSRRWRVLAVAVATVAAVLLVAGGKAYYLGPLYVLGAAAGSVAVEGWLAAEPQRWRLAVGALAANGLVALGAVVPVAPAGVYADLFHDVNGELGEEVGWPEMVDLVAAVVEVLPADEQADVRVIAASYGEAAAIDLYGPARGLPRGTALSAHNAYAAWWPDGEPAGTFVTVRYPRRAIEPYCDAVGPVAVVETIDGVANEMAGTPVLVCRDLRVTPDELRDGLRHLE
ncbi:MAG TPA: glycosyltransferase family 39 protein [Acidimicrobiales bacterium]